MKKGKESSMVNNKYELPFCGLQLKLYETGKTAPSYEYSASSTKAKFMCSLTSKLYGISEVMTWYQTPEVQAYVKAGYSLKWGSKIQEPKEIKYGKKTEQIVCLYMVKPFPSNIDGFKKVKIPPQVDTHTIEAKAPPIQKQENMVEENERGLDDEIPF